VSDALTGVDERAVKVEENSSVSTHHSPLVETVNR
jgi:hypothetical protein